MLKGIDPRLTAELVHVLMQMGHGDDLVLCDLNHPAATIARETTYGSVIAMSGCDMPSAIEAILSLMPIDDFVDAPIARMQVVGDPDAELPNFAAARSLAERIEGRTIGMRTLERFEFYKAAKRSFAIVRTGDRGPYGCFILRMGVIR